MKLVALCDQEIHGPGFPLPLRLSICTEAETGECISRLHRLIERFKSESDFRNEIWLHVDICEIDP